MNTILVTGASGFIGGNIVAELAQEGYHVRCLVRGRSRIEKISKFCAEIVYGDVTDVLSLKKAVNGVDAVVHCAGVTRARNRQEYFKVNAGGTQNLFAAIREFNPGIESVVHLGSLAALGPSVNGEPVTEECAPHPVSDYGASKLAGQVIARSFMNTLPVTILIPPAVYGPMDKDFLVYFKMAMRGFTPFIGSGTNRASLIYVADVARAVADCLDDRRSMGKSYLLEDGKEQTWESMASMIGKTLNKKPIPVHIPVGVANGIAFGLEMASRIGGGVPLLNRQKVREFREEAWVCTSKHIREDLGYVSNYGLEKGLEETARWYSANQWL